MLALRAGADGVEAVLLALAVDAGGSWRKSSTTETARPGSHMHHNGEGFERDGSKASVEEALLFVVVVEDRVGIHVPLQTPVNHRLFYALLRLGLQDWAQYPLSV